MCELPISVLARRDTPRRRIRLGSAFRAETRAVVRFGLARHGCGGAAYKDPWGIMRFGVDAHTTFDRRDYGTIWGNVLESEGVDVGKIGSITLRLEAVKPGPNPAAP